MYIRSLLRTRYAYPVLQVRLRIRTGPVVLPSLHREFMASASLRASGPKNPPNEETWTDKIRSAIISLLPEENQVDIIRQLREDGHWKQDKKFPSSSMDDPLRNSSSISSNHIASNTLHNHHDDVYQEFDRRLGREFVRGRLSDEEINVILHDYRPLKGRLEEDSVVTLAMILYNNGRYVKVCQVFLENLTLGVSLFTGFCDKFVPELSQYHGKEFVLGNIVEAFVSLGHKNTIDQLLGELGEDESVRSRRIADAELVLEIKDKAQDKFAVRDDKMLIDFVHDSSQLWVPQMFVKEHVNLWTRLQIFTIFAMRDPERYIELAFRRQAQQFLGQKYVLRNFISNTILWKIDDPERIKFWNSHNIETFDKLLELWYIPFHPDDVKAITCIPDSPRMFTKTLKMFRRYYKKRCANDPFDAYYNDEVLNAFLKRALDFRQSVDVTHIIKLGACNNPNLIRRAINVVLWGKKKPDDLQDSALVLQPSKDIQFLRNLLSYVPSPVLERALIYFIRKSKESNNLPGRLLWDLLTAIEASPVIEKLPGAFEKHAGVLIASRPHFEQMRYMALSKVSAEGVVCALRNSIMNINASDAKPDVFDADAKLILAGLILLKEKSSLPTALSKEKEIANAPQGNSPVNGEELVVASDPSSPDAYLGRAISDLFLRWDEAKAIDIIQFLSQRDIQPPDYAIVKSVGWLAYKGKFELALKLMDSVPEIPDEAMFKFLIEASKNYPNICTGFLKWMRTEKNVQVPADVMRRIIQGYCHSPFLNSAQCNNRVQTLVGVLRRQNRRVGDRTAIAIVERILKDVQETGQGSRKRLTWAMDLAKQERVPNDIIDGWFKRLDSMRARKQGFWSKKYINRMMALTSMAKRHHNRIALPVQ